MIHLQLTNHCKLRTTFTFQYYYIFYKRNNRINQLLCVSCPSATDFSATLFLLFARSSSNSPRSFQRFRRTLRRTFNRIQQQLENFPIDPHCKKRYNVAESGQFLQWGSMWKLFICCRIQSKFRLRVRLKR